MRRSAFALLFCRGALAALASAALAGTPATTGTPEEIVLIDDFENSEVGQFPAGWSWQDDDDDTVKPYAVAEEAGNRYLSAQDTGQSVIIGRNTEVDIRKFPFLSFRWRVHRLPVSGDERHGETGDSAAAVYIVYRRFLGIVPQTVKYVWSSTVPAGAALQRSGMGRPWVIVADSGEAYLGQWRTHVFDVRAAWRETFGGDPPGRILAVAVLSDANATASQAFADYDDLRFLAAADADSGISRIVNAD